MNNEIVKENISVNELEEMLGSKERVLFYLTWLKHDRNSTKAYAELHPEAKTTTCQANGSKMLSKIPINAITTAYGLGIEKYFEILKNALETTRHNDFTGEKEVDYRTIKPYHDKLGRLLQIEKETQQTNVEVNVMNKLDRLKMEYNLDE